MERIIDIIDTDGYIDELTSITHIEKKIIALIVKKNIYLAENNIITKDDAFNNIETQITYVLCNKKEESVALSM